ncbi:MAG: hypothetical protein J6K20_03180 [Thermoguttaceae bacterium]|nr:hypothetical protein [Thermoguttaceae bacterium]
MNLKYVGSVTLSLVTVACIALGVGYNASTLGSDGAKVDAAQESPSTNVTEPPETPPAKEAAQDTPSINATPVLETPPVQQSGQQTLTEPKNEQVKKEKSEDSFWRSLDEKLVDVILDFVVAKFLDWFWEIILTIFSIIYGWKTRKRWFPWLCSKLFVHARESLKKTLKDPRLKIQWFTKFEKKNNFVWDGQIVIYSPGKLRRKQNVDGYVSFKVKELERKKLPESLRFSVSKADVLNYRRAGGGILFVVCFTPQGFGVYYNLLTPMTLADLEKNATKETLRLECAQLPEMAIDRYRLFCSFKTNVALQQSFFSSEREFDFQQFWKNIKVEDIEGLLVISPIVSKNESTVIFHKDSEKYIGLKSGQLLPCRPGTVTRTRKSSTSLIIDEQSFPLSIEIIEGDNLKKVKIGNCIEIEYKPEPQTTFTFFKDQRLSNLVQEYELCFALAEASCIALRREEHTWLIPKDEAILEFQKHIKARAEVLNGDWQKCAQYFCLFNMLNLDCNIEMSSLTEGDWLMTQMLMGTLVGGQGIELPDETEPERKFIWLWLARQSVYLYAYPIENTNFYRLYDVCQKDFPPLLDCGTAEEKFCAILKGLSAKVLASARNLKLSTLCSWLRGLIEVPEFDRVNCLLLQCILAYDCCSDKASERAQELAQTIAELFEWINDILTKCPNEGNSLIAYLNYLQFVKRCQPLSDEEKNFLNNLLDSEDSSVEFKFAAHILLDEYESASRYWKKFDEEHKQLYRHFPIYTLYTQNCKKQN